MSIDSHGLLFDIRVQSERLIDAGKDALDGTLTTEDDDKDSPEVREKLMTAVRAAKTLLAHLDASYEFDLRGIAEPREGVCLE